MLKSTKEFIGPNTLLPVLSLLAENCKKALVLEEDATKLYKQTQKMGILTNSKKKLQNRIQGKH